MKTSDPALWIGFAVMFVFAAALNLTRGLRDSRGKGSVRLALGASCIAWAAGALCFKFVGSPPAYGCAGLGVVLMVAAAVLSARG